MPSTHFRLPLLVMVGTTGKSASGDAPRKAKAPSTCSSRGQVGCPLIRLNCRKRWKEETYGVQQVHADGARQTEGG